MKDLYFGMLITFFMIMCFLGLADNPNWLCIGVCFIGMIFAYRGLENG